MKRLYCLGLDVAKHKLRAALSGGDGRIVYEADLPVHAAGRAELLAQLRARVSQPAELLVVLEATGVLHLNWSAALTQAGYAVVVINPLIARRFYPIENALRDSKTDPIDARGLCALGQLHGEKLLQKYRVQLEPERLALRRLQTVRKALRTSLTNLKKTYVSLLDLSFPELGQLLEVDGSGIRALLQEAPTPQAIAQKRLRTLEKDWKLRPKAARLKALATDSLADPGQRSRLAGDPARASPPWKRSCAPWTNKSKPAQMRDRLAPAKPSSRPSPASVLLSPAKSWLTCLTRSSTPAVAAKPPPASRPLWGTNRASRKAASGKAKPR